MRVISVYLGSSPFCSPQYKALAHEVGAKIAKKGHTIVYGGAAVGTMGALAQGAKEEGGEIIGVFPRGFKGTKEVRESGIQVIQEGLDRMIDVADFAERKQKMEDIGDCAIVLPGSYGTMDELFTYACNRAIDKHSKNIYVLNHNGFYNPLIDLLSNMEKAGFLKQAMVGAITFYDNIDDILNLL